MIIHLLRLSIGAKSDYAELVGLLKGEDHPRSTNDNLEAMREVIKFQNQPNRWKQ